MSVSPLLDCPNCGSPVGCSCYGDIQDDDYESDFYDDDYETYGSLHDYDPDDDGLYETSHSCQLFKAKNGHIVILHHVLGRYHGEDWDEASYWQESITNLSHLVDEQRLAIVAFAEDLAPGYHDFSYDWLDEDEDDSDSETPAAPTTVDEIPF